MTYAEQMAQITADAVAKIDAKTGVTLASLRAALATAAVPTLTLSDEQRMLRGEAPELAAAIAAEKDALNALRIREERVAKLARSWGCPSPTWDVR